MAGYLLCRMQGMQTHRRLAFDCISMPYFQIHDLFATDFSAKVKSLCFLKMRVRSGEVGVQSMESAVAELVDILRRAG